MLNEPSPEFARPTVLLVEDDDMLRHLLARALGTAGLGVIQARNGAEALDVARGFAGSIGLVVTDISMPVMNGFVFAQVFQPLYPSVPILFMTGALPVVSNGISLRQVGEHLLLKPFSPDVFLEAVSTMLAHYPSVQRSSA